MAYYSRTLNRDIARMRGNADTIMPTPKSTIEWIDPCRDIPDDDETVLVALSNGGVWFGLRNQGLWYYATGSVINPGIVWWAHLPEHPKTKGTP